MTVYATAGAKLYIGGVKNVRDVNAATFASETWTEIKEVEALGSVGDTSEAIPFASLADARQRVLKGTRSAGTMEVICGIDSADPGQLAAIAAEQTSYNYAFRIVLRDEPPGGTPSERLFVAMVMSQSEQFDQVNSVMKLNLSLAVNSNVHRIAAAED